MARIFSCMSKRFSKWKEREEKSFINFILDYYISVHQLYAITDGKGQTFVFVLFFSRMIIAGITLSAK
jgi:hypothetical protein